MSYRTRYIESARKNLHDYVDSIFDSLYQTKVSKTKELLLLAKKNLDLFLNQIKEDD